MTCRDDAVMGDDEFVGVDSKYIRGGVEFRRSYVFIYVFAGSGGAQ